MDSNPPAIVSTDIPHGVATIEYAGFWLRVAAALIDGLILCALGVGLMIFAFFSFIPLSLGGSATALMSGIAGANTLSTLLSWLYYSLQECSQHQATFGKRAVGIRVTDVANGRISFPRATGRYFGKILSALFFGIGFLMVAFTGRKQGLHDMLAGTLVVKYQG